MELCSELDTCRVKFGIGKCEALDSMLAGGATSGKE